MISIVMGSDSDMPVVQHILDTLKEYEVGYTVNVISAHRAPERLAKHMRESKADVFIGVAGKAAHLPGVMAAYTVKPVIGLPVRTSDLGGMDSLLSIVQMPTGIPVATVAINGGKNAGILAVQMLALFDTKLQEKLIRIREKNQNILEQKDRECQNL